MLLKPFNIEKSVSNIFKTHVKSCEAHSTVCSVENVFNV